MNWFQIMLFKFRWFRIKLPCKFGKHNFGNLIASVLGRDCLICDYHEPYVSPPERMEK